MTNALTNTFTEPTARIALVTERQLQTLATIQGLFDLQDEDERRRAWATLGRKEAAALIVVMMLTAVFDEEVVCKLLVDLTDCHEAGCTNPTIIVSADMEGGGE